ncbi:MAG: glutamyl-tRNA reductase, partial [[Actinobacillus] rossii]|nr:glutamyl-tRNA reductase [[Actinobacillus] rossii]
MTILVLGINHKTASVGLREKVAFSEEKRQLALQQIHQLGLGQSAIVLSTCNRTEIYLHNKNITPEQSAQWNDECVVWFAQIHQIDLFELQSCLYLHQNQQAAQHLMRVACGLDSLILGEPQILGQVKQAYQMSEDYYHNIHQSSVSSELSRLFQKTFST